MNTTTAELRPGASAHSSQEHARRLTRIGRGILLGAVAPIALWMCVAPLSMAVVAPAFVKVDLNRRPVQHREGGIVREVLVRDGQHVLAGDPVLVLGDVGVDADRNRLEYRLQVERATAARLEAERVLSQSLVFPDELLRVAQGDARIALALTKEKALFETRRDSLAEEITLLKTQREHIEREIAALKAQIAEAQSSLALQKKNLESHRALVDRGFVARTKVAEIGATVADYASRMDEQRAELARAEQRMIDTELKIISVQNEYVRMASDQLKEITAQLNEVEQELRKSEDAAHRQVVVAPASGNVIDLKFTSPGAVIGPGESIAEIVPSDAKLYIEARIRPEEISHVHQDQEARIKFTAFKYRSTSLVTGKVTYTSADRLVDRTTNQSYYNVMILADPDSLEAVGDLKLQAGMPAEVYIEGTQQTPLQYLMEPITSTIRKAGREI
ncbi:MAG TPA: HlyD family type I secretion periplasmic adaptor subunit [Methylococcaceae bacterium]|nr:HlyD family type I secretion periplasmic adaptor subunit [Methylococcaceae bacterium]